MKVILVETPSKRQVPPLGLMKLSTWHKKQGHDVWCQRGGFFHTNDEVDWVEIASPDFTWDVPEALACIQWYKCKYPNAKIRVGGTTASDSPDFFYKHTGIQPTIGRLPDVDLCKPDYSLFPDMKYSLVYTSFGCSMGCPFCRIGTAVRPEGQEGTVVCPIRTWREHIDLSRKKVVIQDNNIFGAKKEHLSEVIAFLKEHKLEVDFNSGFEVHQVRESAFEEMKGLRIRPIRTAFDELREEKEAQRTIELIHYYLTRNFRQIMVYVLYNFYEPNAREYDTPETALYRCQKVLEWGAIPYVMPYFPLFGWYRKDYKVSPYWTRRKIMKFRRFFDKYQIVLSVWTKNQKITMEDVFGKDIDPTERLANQSLLEIQS